MKTIRRIKKAQGGTSVPSAAELKRKELEDRRNKLQRRNDSIKQVRQSEYAAKKKVSDSLAADREKKFVESATKAGMTRDQYSKYLDKQSKKPDVSSSEGAGFDEKRYRRVCGPGGCKKKNGGSVKAKDGKWMQKAAASIKRRGTAGKCTPITKPGCTGKAKALAKTFKKIAAKRKAK